MHTPDGLPILGKASQNGGGNLAAIDKKYAVGLTTPDGAEHVYVFQMGRPTNPDGSVDLGALAGFNPRRDALRAVVEQIGGAWYGNPTKQPFVMETETGEFVVLRHVVSFRYLGPVEELTPMAGEAG